MTLYVSTSEQRADEWRTATESYLTIKLSLDTAHYEERDYG